MVVAAIAHSELLAANRAVERALHRIEALEGIGAHLGLTVTFRYRRIRIALCALREAEMARLAAAERDHRWYMTYRRARSRLFEQQQMETAS